MAKVAAEEKERLDRLRAKQAGLDYDELKAKREEKKVEEEQ